jgi:hypothetical protein
MTRTRTNLKAGAEAEAFTIELTGRRRGRKQAPDRERTVFDIVIGILTEGYSRTNIDFCAIFFIYCMCLEISVKMKLHSDR